MFLNHVKKHQFCHNTDGKVKNYDITYVSVLIPLEYMYFYFANTILYICMSSLTPVVNVNRKQIV